MRPFFIESNEKGFQGFQSDKGVVMNPSFIDQTVNNGKPLRRPWDLNKMTVVDAKERRRLFKAYCVEFARVEAIRCKILTDKRDAKRRAEFFVDQGLLPARPVLPSLPALPPECVGMVCGGKGRRSGRPCQCREIYPNGRCKWHGGASTGPKTAEGKARSQSNLRRGSKL